MASGVIGKRIGLAALVVAVAGAGSVALADTTAVTDREKETRRLKRHPELDIARATAGHAVGGRLKHRVTMRGRVQPDQPRTRPLILINTRGGPTSAYEYVVLGRHVLRRRGEDVERVGASRLTSRKRTWVYRFHPDAIGDPDSYGWAAFTSKGKAKDVTPGRRYEPHQLAG